MKDKPENNGAEIHQFERIPGIGRERVRNTCGDCAYFQINPQNVGTGTCHGNPPQAVLLPSPNGQHSAMSFYPPIGARELRCRHFKDSGA